MTLGVGSEMLRAGCRLARTAAGLRVKAAGGGLTKGGPMLVPAQLRDAEQRIAASDSRYAAPPPEQIPARRADVVKEQDRLVPAARKSTGEGAPA